MARQIDIWTPEQVDIFTDYAIGNDDKVRKAFSDNEICFNFLESLMKDKHSNSLIRERVAVRLEGYIHSSKMHDYDAFDSTTQRFVEAKNEQHSTLDNRRNQVTGGGAFGIEDLGSVTKLVADNPIMCVSAWYDGRIAYTVSFNFNDSSIAARLTNTISQRCNKKKKTKPKFMWSDWRDASSLSVTYFNQLHFNMLTPFISRDLVKKIIKIK
jgi:hypothetical protein